MLCSICYKSRTSEETFRSVAASLRYDYILEEYSSLSDAWRVFQGVALYREYRGIGGVTTTQLDVTPRPCHLCLVKIVNMAQSIYQVTTAIQPRPSVSKSCEESDTETEVFRPSKSPDDVGSEDSDDSQFTKNSEASQEMKSKPDFKKDKDLLAVREASESKEESAASTSEDRPDLGVRERPRRSAGRSLFERNPDFAMGSQFARLLRQKGLREGKPRGRREREAASEKVGGSRLNKNSSPKERDRDSSDQEEEEEETDWRHSTFRASQLSRLDEALSVAGWVPAIRNGRNLETKVFKTSNSQSEYVAGINQLIKHFRRPNQTSLLKPSLSAGLGKRTVKPTRKILDGLDFRRKPKKKIQKSKLRSQLEQEHSIKSEKDGELLVAGEDKIPEKADNKDTISVCDSEFSMSSHGTNDSYERSQNSKPVGRKKVSMIRETFAVPEPERNSSDVVAGRIKSDSEVIYEASVSQKVRY